jgi:RNA polymerase sigma factor (sigma-70 family)
MQTDIIPGLINSCEYSFETVYYTYRDKLYFYFLKKTKDESVCKDLVQEVFIKLWRYRKSLRPDLDLSIQVFRIAKTTLIDVLRKHASQRTISVPENALHHIAEPATNGEPDNERVVYLHREIKMLPPVRKQILQYRLQGFSNQEIAVKLSISKKTVENQLNRAFHDIKKNADMPALMAILILKSTLL